MDVHLLVDSVPHKPSTVTRRTQKLRSGSRFPRDAFSGLTKSHRVDKRFLESRVVQSGPGGIMVELDKFGKKHACQGCGVKFYDMHKPQPVCPRCGASQNGKSRKKAEPVFLVEEDLDDAVGRVFDDDLSLPGDLDLEVGGLDGDDSELPIMADDLLGDEEDDDLEAV
ncbi:MAG: FYDLN acid domain-containing protein [Pseudomonadota bacterium]